MWMGQIGRSALVLLCTAALGSTVACGGDDESKGGASSTGGKGGTGGSATGGHDSGGAAGNVANTGCPGRLPPFAPRGKIEVVGDGTPASCTADALSAAVAAATASDGGTVRFDCGSAPHTIVLTRSIAIDGKLLLDGEDRITLSGGGKVRVLDLAHHTELAVQRLTIRDGKTSESGGGIHHPWFGTLQVIDVVFEDNHASPDQGEIGGGAIFAGGLREVVISGSQFVDNTASNGGGVLNRGSTLTIVDTVFRNNDALSYAESGQYGNGGGLYIDGMAYEEVGPAGDFRLCGSVFERNHARQHGSAIFGYFYPGSSSYLDRSHFDANDFADSPGGSGGVYHESVPLFLTNSTFSNNTSNGHAAALFIGSTAGTVAHVTSTTFFGNVTPGNAGGIFSGKSPVHLASCTFAANEADYAPAIFKGESASVTVKNTIFFDNRTQNQYSALACHESFTDEGGNFQWPAKRKSGSADTPCVEGITFADPRLGPLGDHGGLTPTLVPAAGSPVIDAGNGCPETDQTGAPRIGACDSGAVEQR